VAVPRYNGPFGRREAERLLWRAGFGPRPGQADDLARKGLGGAVSWLTRPPALRLEGQPPTDDRGNPIAPQDVVGHDHLWWFDRMVRGNQPLVERMTLVWHDWFATAEAETDLLLDQNRLFRRHALGSFEQLLLDITVDPAMLLFLSGSTNWKDAPNENYARELMELFTLGADAGYTEDDVREQARALTGWRNDWDSSGAVNFRFDPARHDTGIKRIFGRSGNFDWRDSCRLCLEHPRHPTHFVQKLWSAFIPSPPSDSTLSGLKSLYLSSDYAIRPVVEAILKHPDLYDGPRMVKPPVVFIAGMLRGLERPVRGEGWIWSAQECGQRLFRPPNVSGWDEDRWLDTATWRGRWRAANLAVQGREAEQDGYDPAERADVAVQKAVRFWGNATLNTKTRDELVSFARHVDRLADDRWEEGVYRARRQNALRMLVATSPDLQTS
jgi:uncharacterized protein (DUF1800 family)